MNNRRRREGPVSSSNSRRGRHALDDDETGSHAATESASEDAAAEAETASELEPAWPSADADAGEDEPSTATAPQATEDTTLIGTVGWDGTVSDPSSDEALDADTEGEPTNIGAGRARRLARGLSRTVAALISIAVLTGTAFGWRTIDWVQSNINTSNVLANHPGAPPAGDQATDILLVGNDTRNDAQGNPLPLSVLKKLRTEATNVLNTDTIILIRVPDNGGQPSAVSIPRDSYVQMVGGRKEKINAVYALAKSKTASKLRADGVTDSRRIEQESDQAGRRALVGTVQQLTGARIDHYAEVNLLGFYLLTEALGGVKVCLKEATSDPDSGADFAAGPQTISGGDALSFVRQRKNLPRGDLDRIVRQQVFMSAVANKILSTGTLSDSAKMQRLTEAAKRSVVLDEGWDVLGFARQMQTLAAGSVAFHTIPVAGVGAHDDRGQSIVTVDPRQVQRFFDTLAAGARPPAQAAVPTFTPPPKSSSPPSASSRSSTPATVEVLNGTTIDGLAGRVSEHLGGKGYRTGQEITVSAKDRSAVYASPAKRDAAEELARALGGLPVSTDSELSEDRIQVVLGSDYGGPARLGPKPLVQLDGGATRTPAHTQSSEDGPVTRYGMTCVN